MNRLAQSLSPYLLQHQHNPVDWFPWCDEAFELARQHDKPIFLSVGYAACHWCHVMERESFENHQTAAVLNEHFVSIKVDREERPDIDQIYMNAVQVMTGRGGWPMSVFLNHDRQPFFAGTYWPPQQRFGMPGFMQVLDAIADAWKERRGEVNQHAGQIAEALKQLAHGGVDPSSETIDDASVVDEAVGRLMRVLDPVYGGFGGAPKFPHATDLELLLRYSVTRDRSDCMDAVELTLDRMAAGGIRDHIGGGFARYSVDTKWLVPHFEKMLYDNALLAQVYLRAFQATGHDRHAKVVRETLDYLCREMVDPDGGIHCSEDADSEGVEGKFYVWTPDQVAEVLGAERAERFCAIYDITRHGNFEGHNIPNLPVSIDEWGAKLGVEIDELQSQLAGDREKLRQARDERQHPGRDDKVLTAWNALAIRSLAASGAILDEPRYVEAAQRAAKFIFARMARTDGRLLHVFRAGRAHQDAFLDDYAYMVEACLTLFEATGETSWVMHATQLADMLLAHFQDSVNGGFYYTAQDAETLIARTKDWHDGSLISGNASAASGLLALARLTGRDDYRQAVARTLKAAGDILQQQSAACAGLLAVLDSFRSDPCPQVVVAVPDENEQRRVRSSFLRPYRPLVTRCWVVATQDQGSALIELTRDRIPIDGRLTVYVCHDFRCELPLVGKEAESWLAAGNVI